MLIFTVKKHHDMGTLYFHHLIESITINQTTEDM